MHAALRKRMATTAWRFRWCMLLNMGDQSSEGTRLTEFGAALVRREIWILLLVGALLYVIAVLLPLEFTGIPESVQRGIQDLGVSIVEAALVMAIIDTRASREQIDQSLRLISKATSESKGLIHESIEETKRAAAQSQELTRQAIESVFDAVYRKKVPRELVEHYESVVFDRKLFRRSEKYIYTLKVPPGARAEDFMPVSVYREFRMHNLTENDLDYEFACETSLPPGGSTAQKPKYFELRVDGLPVTVGDGEVVQRSGYEALVLKHKVVIPKKAHRHFEVRFETVRRVRDAELLITTWPSDGATIDVHYDPTLEISANALHALELTPVPTGPTSSKWTLAAGMVPGHGVCLQWEPKRVAGDTHGSH